MAQKPQDEELKRINLQNLKKQEDKSITDILGTASHTTLYRFDNNSCQWDRVGVEGTTFIVTADTVPSARLIVLNKLDVETYTLDVAQINKVKLQSPYLMLRLHANNKHKIMGLWFHNDEERGRIKDAMERAMALIPAAERTAAASTTTSAPAVTTKVQTTTTNVDEFSMESMSQNTTVFHDQTHKDGAPVELDKSLPNNFAKVKKEAQSQPPAVTVTAPVGKNKGMALLQSLKSNPSSSDDLLTDYAITTTAAQANGVKAKVQKKNNANDKDVEAVVASMHEVQIAMAKPTTRKLYAPSDITGQRRQFLKKPQ